MIISNRRVFPLSSPKALSHDKKQPRADEKRRPSHFFPLSSPKALSHDKKQPRANAKRRPSPSPSCVYKPQTPNKNHTRANACPARFSQAIRQARHAKKLAMLVCLVLPDLAKPQGKPCPAKARQRPGGRTRQSAGQKPGEFSIIQISKLSRQDNTTIQTSENSAMKRGLPTLIGCRWLVGSYRQRKESYRIGNIWPGKCLGEIFARQSNVSIKDLFLLFKIEPPIGNLIIKK